MELELPRVFETFLTIFAARRSVVILSNVVGHKFGVGGHEGAVIALAVDANRHFGVVCVVAIFAMFLGDLSLDFV